MRMVDFSKHIIKKKSTKEIDPVEIYNTLDHASDIGELRPAQKEILRNWYQKYKDQKDTIIKLHTGKGKTLIGLLILKSKINAGEGPCLYLCPNRYLVEQTCKEAERFGIDVCTDEDGIPTEFENGEKILITTTKKLFNGLSVFKFGAKSIPVNTIVFDDSHACLDEISDSFTMKIDRIKKGSATQIYKDLFLLFQEALKKQALGTCEEIMNGNGNSYIVVPYWEWHAKIEFVTSIISKYADSSDVKFVWPLLKDELLHCQCIISTDSIEISPYLIPVEKFGSFHNAKNRIYMSATTNNDSFFIKHLNISDEAITNPITFNEELWSGEKMILIPSLIDEGLDKDVIMEYYTKSIYEKNPKPNYGICILTPSKRMAKPWENNGATMAMGNDISTVINSLKEKKFDKPVVFVNRYDGIDLPDATCRCLIFDGIPYSEKFADKYFEDCVPDTELTNTKIAQKIEQGLGRNIRGNRDYGAIIILGKDLIKFIRTNKYKKYFSQQTQQQIEIGFEIARYSKEDLTSPLASFIDVVEKMLTRDEGWKEFYISRMNETTKEKEHKFLDILRKERNAELAFKNGETKKAIDIIQKYINENSNISAFEKGWYLEQIARYKYVDSPVDSIKIQTQAHKLNNYLLKPKNGIQIDKIDSKNIIQAELIAKNLKNYTSYNDLRLAADDILDHLQFNTESEKFEQAIEEFGIMLGFASQRPDKQWNEGPDNLWAVAPNEYFVIECKNMVQESRGYISRSETGQMNNSYGWFQKNYQNANPTNIMITPILSIENGGAFNCDVNVIRNKNLKKLKDNFDSFIKEFKNTNIENIVIKDIYEKLKYHKLAYNDFSIYFEKPKEVIIQ